MSTTTPTAPKPTILDKIQKEIVLVAGTVAAIGVGVDLSVVPAGVVRDILAVLFPLAAAVASRAKVIPLAKVDAIIAKLTRKK